MPIDRKKIVFYLWAGLAYSMLWLFANSHKYPGNFFPLLSNNIWRVIYIIILNFIFFEYVVPVVPDVVEGNTPTIVLKGPELDNER